MCGLFGWVGRNPKTFDKHKFDILGIMNETRGKDSCGISVDGDIMVGVDKTKIYRDWLAITNYNVPTTIPIVLGHTRYATFGMHTTDNAHPFGFGKNNDEYDFIGVHNGSLLNDVEIADKRAIPITTEKLVQYETHTANTSRTKIDSEILLECLYRDKNFKVLSEYNGAAALLFYNTAEPNVLYAFHGASPLKDGEPQAYIERPLFYYAESKYSLYISSLEESLFAIGGNSENVAEFDTNVVYKITAGNIEQAELFNISRKKNYQKEGFPSIPITPTIITGKTNKMSRAERKRARKEDVNTLNIHTLKKTDQNAYKGKVYEHKLRYWRNGSLIEGCYVWIPSYGFYKVGTGILESKKVISRFLDVPFYNDFITTEAELIKFQNASFIPFPKHNFNAENVKLYYFYKGIRIRTRFDYEACLINGNIAKWDYDTLSICSFHPVIDEKGFRVASSQNILWDDKPWTGTISLLGSENIYYIVNGNLVKIKEVDKNPIMIQDKMLEVMENFEATVENNIDENLLNDRIESDIDSILLPSYKKFPSDIKLLKTYKGNKKAQTAVIILENYVRDATTLVAIETND